MRACHVALARRVAQDGTADHQRRCTARAGLLDQAGAIVDGRNRLKACELAEIEPRFESINGADILGLVISLNAKRCDLTLSLSQI